MCPGVPRVWCVYWFLSFACVTLTPRCPVYIAEYLGTVMSPSDVAFTLTNMIASGDYALEADGVQFFADGISVAGEGGAPSGSSSDDTTSIAGQGVWLLVVIAVAGTVFLVFVILVVARRRSAKRGKEGGRVVGSAMPSRSQGGILNPLYADAGDAGAGTSSSFKRQTSMSRNDVGGRRVAENPLYEGGKINPLFDGFVGLPEDHDGHYDEIGDLGDEAEGFYQEMGNMNGDGDGSGYLDVGDGDAYMDVHDDDNGGYLDVPAEAANADFEERDAMFGFDGKPSEAGDGSDDDGGYLDVNADDEVDE